jgi:D-3-phosphoglycerate dehydrogenase / 2-oxoglutarate reductase
MHRILATPRSFAKTTEAQELLQAQGCTVDLFSKEHPLLSYELAEKILGYDALIIGLDNCNADVIKAADKLKVISRNGAGYDKVDLKAASSKNIVVAYAPGANTIGVAELTMGLLYALARDIPSVSIRAKQGQWQRVMGWELAGKTLGIIGLGAIGREVAKRALANDMRIIAYDPYAKPYLNVELNSLDTVLEQADILSLHTALTPETRDLITAERLAQMKKGAYLINTARGGLIDENALYDALKQGKLAGAAMDAFATEPPDGNPLLTLDNFIATPHIGANTKESVARANLQAAQNVLDILKGRENAFILNSRKGLKVKG